MSRKSAGQQRTIAFIMPVIIGLFSFMYKWPAGLMIYWFTTNLWSVAQQFVAEKIMPVPVAAAAILEKDKAKLAKAKGGGKPGAAGGKPGAAGGKPAGTPDRTKASGQSGKQSAGKRR
jgi:YidC/Oxa1 family membrane protein insertase